MKSFPQMLCMTLLNLYPQEEHFSTMHYCIAGDSTGLFWRQGFSHILDLVRNNSFQTGMKRLPLRQMKNDDLLLNKFPASCRCWWSHVRSHAYDWSGENVINRIFFFSSQAEILYQCFIFICKQEKIITHWAEGRFFKPVSPQVIWLQKAVRV